jgi:hypothetical protein
VQNKSTKKQTRTAAGRGGTKIEQRFTSFYKQDKLAKYLPSIVEA